MCTRRSMRYACTHIYPFPTTSRNAVRLCSFFRSDSQSGQSRYNSDTARSPPESCTPTVLDTAHPKRRAGLCPACLEMTRRADQGSGDVAGERDDEMVGGNTEDGAGEVEGEGGKGGLEMKVGGAEGHRPVQFALFR